MTQLFSNQSFDAVSNNHTLAVDTTTIVATGAPWGRARMVLMIETAVGSGDFVAVPDMEFVGPGSKNLIANSSAGLRIHFLLLDAELAACSISATAN